jgi:hypothetical protein
MKSVPKTSERKPYPGCTIFEFNTDNPEINTVIVEIGTRYPEKGWARNNKVTLHCYVIRGCGNIYIKEEDGTIRLEYFQTNRLIEIKPGDIYYWEAIKTDFFKMCVTSAPAWTLDQHENIAD